MNKSKLTTELISNALDFYNENLGKAFSESEVKNLSKKLLNIIKYDHIIKGPLLPYDLPQYTLTIIYFIGEYKKAYKYASQDKKDRYQNTVEALDKGYPRKEKAYRENKEKMNDASLSSEDRAEAFFKTIIFLLLKKPDYAKVSILLLTHMYSQYQILKKIFINVDKFNKMMHLVMSAQEDALQTLEYTYLSKDKMVNSSVIMIFTVLTAALKLDEKEAFKHTKDLVYSFIDKTPELTDKYRKEYITDKDIYCAGVYNSLPIYTWYTGKNKSYYNDEDIKKMKVIFRAIPNIKDMTLVEKDVSLNMLRMYDKNASLADIEKAKKEEEIIKFFKSSYKQFALAPFSLLQYIAIPNKSIILWIKALVYALITKFTELKTIFTKK